MAFRAPAAVTQHPRRLPTPTPAFLLVRLEAQVPLLLLLLLVLLCLPRLLITTCHHCTGGVGGGVRGEGQAGISLLPAAATTACRQQQPQQQEQQGQERRQQQQQAGLQAHQQPYRQAG